MLQNIRNRIRIPSLIGTGVAILSLAIGIMNNFSWLYLVFVGNFTLFVILTVPRRISSQQIQKYLFPYISGVAILASGLMYVNGFPVAAVLTFLPASALLLARKNQFTLRQLQSLSGSIAILVAIWYFYSGELVLGSVAILMAVTVFRRLVIETIANLRH